MIVTSMLLGRLTATWLVLAASAAGAEPLTLDRLLKMEALGTSALSPDGRRLVIETRAPYDEAASFDFESSGPRLGRLMVADLAADRPAHPLLKAEPGAGYTAGPFSPDGRRMIISRWKDYASEAGVVDLDTGKVSWLGFGLEQANFGRSLQWLSSEVFVALARDSDDPTLKLKLGWQNQKRLTALWAQQAAGKVATVKVVGSGRARRPEPMQDRRLVRVDLGTGAQSVLARGGFFDMELSPSGRYVALLEEAERVGLVATPAVRMMAPSRRRALSIVDLKTGVIARPCTSCTTLIEPMVWAPKSDRLLVFQHPVDQLEDAGHLTMINAASGESRAVGDGLTVEFDYGGEGAARVRADWLGEHPILRAKSDPTGREDWYDVADRRAINLTRALPSAPQSIAIERGKDLLALADGKTWRVDAAGSTTLLPGAGTGWLRPPTFGAGLRPRSAAWRSDYPLLRTATGLTDPSGHAQTVVAGTTLMVLPDGRRIVSFTPPSGVQTVSMLDGHGRRDLLTLNGDSAKLDTGLVRTVEARTSSGEILKSWLYMPPTWRPGTRPPLIVVPYPGSAPQTLPWNFTVQADDFTPNPPLLAAQGYAVLVPAMPHDRSLGQPAHGVVGDILSAVDAAIAQGLADPDRLALWGHSFGGYAALVTATQTERFKAIIDQAGPSDFVSSWAGVDPHFVTAPEDGGPSPIALAFNETGQGGMAGPPWAQTERYLRNSPLLQADKVATPLMLIYGDQDFVGLAQGQAMFNALYRQNKDATLLTLMGERHIPNSPANIRAIYGEVLPWLAARLGSRSAPVSAEAPRPSQ
jgi:dipeptidyl aminopeptidase/acylaminoacyl peptidase